MNDKSGAYCTYFCLEISLTCRFNSENRRFLPALQSVSFAVRCAAWSSACCEINLVFSARIAQNAAVHSLLEMAIE